MGDRKTIFALVAIMIVVATVIGGLAIAILYNTALEQQRWRLTELAQSQARIMEAVMRNKLELEGHDYAAAVSDIIEQIKLAHENFKGFGNTGEFTLARIEGDRIEFVLRHRHHDLENPSPVPFRSDLAEPMRRALSGQSGTMIGLDYRGVTVLAAYEPVALFDMGIVAKIDLVEVRAPFLRAGGMVTMIAVVIVLAGSALFFRVSNPMIGRRRESHARLVEAQQLAKVGSWEWDIETYEIHGSDEFFRIFGMDPKIDRFTFNEFISLVHPDERKFVRDYMLDLSRDETRISDIEYRIVLPDESECIIATSGEVFRNKDGNADSVRGTIKDITEQKRALQEIKESEEKFRAITHSSSTAMIIATGDDGLIAMWNPAAEKMFGYSEAEALGTPISRLTPERYRDVHAKGWKRVDESKELRLAGDIIEVEGLRKDGREFPIELTLGTWTVGDKAYVSAMLYDISERKQAEEALRQAQRLEAVGQLTGGVAHDFNNLLAIMIGSAELLEEAVGDEGEPREQLEAIKAAIGRGSSLTGRLLAFSRQQVLSPAATDVSSLIDGLHDLLRRTLGETIDLRVESTPDLWPATIDPHQFENALINLAINARDAMGRGGTLVIVSSNVTLDETYAAQHEEVTPGDYVNVAVSDSGSGMSPEVLEQVFEPFFTTKEVGRGSGLGLSMVYGFVKQSNGHISIYSEIDYGTVVKIYMPRAEAAAVKPVAEDEVVELALGSERILVVEDDPNLRRVSASLLRRGSYEVVEAGDGEQAIAQLNAGQLFDLLFTDLVLPGGMSGVEIAQEAKRLQPGIKVLFTSGYAENVVVHNGVLDRGAAVVNKPYQSAELLKRVRTLLDSEGG